MIETARLALYPPQQDDLAFIQAEINTASMMAYLGGAVRSAAETEQGLADDIAAFANGEWLRWTVRRRDDGRRIGRIGLFTVRSASAPEALRGQREIGWMLAEAAQGQGYASEAARAVLAYGFSQLDLSEIYSQTSDSNAPSTRMMQQLGFTRRRELEYVDPDYPAADNPTTVYCLTRTAWSAQP